MPRGAPRATPMTSGRWLDGSKAPAPAQILRTSRLRGNTTGAAAVPAPHDAEEDTTAQHDGDILRDGCVRAATTVVALVERR